MAKKVNRRTFIKGAAAAAAAGAASWPHVWVKNSDHVYAAEKEIKVGILWSLSGSTAIVESAMGQAAQLAINQLNEQGGVLGRKVVPIVEDPATNPRLYSEKAAKLVLKDKCASVFGCYTSASRKAVLPVFEKRKSLFWYPSHYEGSECSKNIIYGGAVPNQMQDNFVQFFKKMGKSRYFIVGSDYVFPREQAKVCKILLEKYGGEWLGDEYLPLGDSEWGATVKKIKDSGCDVVFSNVVGDSGVAFYREYKNQGIDMKKVPIVSSVTSEIHVKAMGIEYAIDSYASLPYFQTVDHPANHKYVEDWQRFAGKDKPTYYNLNCAYFAIFLWAKAVEQAGTVDPLAIRDAAMGQEVDAPQGPTRIEPANLHVWLTPRIGKVLPDASFEIVDEYPEPVMPLPYAAYGETPTNMICKIRGLDSDKLKA
jgi:urea transport system substrate-binding protein